jgi:glycerol-3-phosphate dehydrogenase (NAD(P)+)
MAKISLIGAGAWGLAIANTIAHNKNKISVYSNEEDVIKEVNKYHTTHRLPGVKLSNRIIAKEDIISATKSAKFIFIVTPSQAVKEVLLQIREGKISNETIFITCSKGIDENNLKLFSELVKEIFPHNPHATISGPNFAIEVAKKLPSVTTIACADQTVAKKISKLLQSEFFLPILSTDVINAQICGIVKNVLAIGCGIIEGLRLGENAKAALLVKGVEEMGNLVEKLGGKREEFLSPAGFGDLFLTCSSRDSRNNNLGFLIGKGTNPNKILSDKSTVYEGATSVKSIIALAKKHNINMPLSEMIYSILYEKKINEDLEQIIQNTILQ